jgi:hypothetical protein
MPPMYEFRELLKAYSRHSPFCAIRVKDFLDFGKAMRRITLHIAVFIVLVYPCR